MMPGIKYKKWDDFKDNESCKLCSNCRLHCYELMNPLISDDEDSGSFIYECILKKRINIEVPRKLVDSELDSSLKYSCSSFERANK